MSCDSKMSVKIKGMVYWAMVRPAQKYKLEVTEIRMLRWMCGGYEGGQYKKWKKMRDNESGGNGKESPGKEVEVVWACDEKRRALCRKVCDGIM